MPSSARPNYRIEPLSGHHARTAFDCGVRRLNEYLADGTRLQEANLARLFVAVERGVHAGDILGYYAIHNHHVEVRDISSPDAAQLRRDAVVGAVYAVMVGVTKARQRQGIGSFLFADLLRRTKRISEDTRTWCVVLDALNDDAERFYRAFGFETLVGGTRRLFLPVSRIPARR